MIAQTQQLRPLFTLSSQPVYSQLINNYTLSYALTNQSIELVDLNKFASKIIPTSHTKRINMVRQFADNLLLTCSNDGTVKLWDSRSFEQVGTCKRTYQMYSTCLDQNTIYTGSIGRVTFWDRRILKQTKSYQQSFNGDVTDIKVRNGQLFACATDGIVACFNPKTQIQEDAAEWIHVIGHPAQTLRLQGQYSVLSTTDYFLITVNEQMFQKNIQMNSAQQPRHLVWHNFDNNNKFEYVCWNLNDSTLQKWYDGTIQHYAEGVSDIDFLQIINGQALGTNSSGNLFFAEFTKQANSNQILSNQMQQQQEIIKPKYNKTSGGRKYCPI